MELIALLSSGKGTWGQVAGLINRGEWDKTILVISDFFKSIIKNFDFSKKADIIFIDFNKDIKKVIEEIREKLKNKVQGTEIALSIASGSGKEHMALISALLQLPVGIKFVVLTKEGITEI
ncbi:MAG: hypothetical protein IB618_03325 [Candidatus Pacearchaeota archaeon]|nr:MAG: hypothetical protein IB618_03325 [Candidatus Pacearchaeota archaeon]